MHSKDVIQSGKQILLVDDDQDFRWAMGNVLQAAGYGVTYAEDGDEALDTLGKQPPDLVLLDYMMPGKNGLHVAHELKERIPAVPILMITAYAEIKSAVEAIKMGIYDYVTKPIDNNAFLFTVQRALKERDLVQERLDVILRSIGDGIIAIDIAGKILFLNRAAEEITGWLQEDAVGKYLEEVFAVVDSKNEKATGFPASYFLDMGHKGQTDKDVVFLDRRDGTRRILSTSGSSIRGLDGNVVGIALMFRDITEKKRMEEGLIRVGKLESVGVLAGGIAHDFNNLLAAIIGNIDIATAYIDSDSPARKRLESAMDGADRAKSLTQQLITFSRGGSPVKKKASIVNIIKESVEFVLSGSNVKCLFDLLDDLWKVEVDEGQINQVINNLVINADQAMTDGGVIKISGQNLVVSSDNYDLPLSPGRYVKISVADNGMGIAEEDLPRIFDPFYSNKDNGTGLGLAICHSVMIRHGGFINVESKIGKGTTFHIYLPVSS